MASLLKGAVLRDPSNVPIQNYDANSKVGNIQNFNNINKKVTSVRGVAVKPVTRSNNLIKGENRKEVGKEEYEIPKPFLRKETEATIFAIEKALLFDKNLKDPSCFSTYAEAAYQISREREINEKKLWFSAAQVVSAQPAVGAQILEWKKSGVNLLFGLQNIFKVSDEVTIIANFMLDRILGLKQFQYASEMTLVSATCFWIAVKYEVAYIQRENPSAAAIPTLAEITENCGLNQAAILFCEGVLLDALNWTIDFPKPRDFINRYCLVFSDMYCGVNKANRIQSLACYLSELAMHEPFAIGIPASKVAAACVMLAHKIDGIDDSWSSLMEGYTDYSRESLKDLTRHMIANLRTIRNSENGESHAGPSHYQNVRKKWWNSWGSNEWA